MSVYKCIKDELGDRTFETIDEYKDCVRAIVSDMVDDLGRALRYYTDDRGWEDTDVVIEEVLANSEKNDEEEE